MLITRINPSDPAGLRKRMGQLRGMIDTFDGSSEPDHRQFVALLRRELARLATIESERRRDLEQPAPRPVKAQEPTAAAIVREHDEAKRRTTTTDNNKES